MINLPLFLLPPPFSLSRLLSLALSPWPYVSLSLSLDAIGQCGRQPLLIQ